MVAKSVHVSAVRRGALLFAIFGLVHGDLVGRSHAEESPSGIVMSVDTDVPRIASPIIDVDRRRSAKRPSNVLSERDRRFAELSKMVDAFELRNAILRTASDLTRPSIVHIEAQKTRVVSDGRVVDKPVNDTNGTLVEEAGSGIVVRFGSNDVVLTNRHVIHEAQLKYIRIHFHDGRTVHPTRIVSDDATDVAILGFDLPDVIPARVGNSDELSVGDFVLAFGSPFGLSHSVTQGIVSAKGRRDLIVGAEHVRIQDFIQTDAAINPGNSGGALANLRGEIVGMNTAIASQSGVNAGIGFAMPINIAMFVGQQLVENGEVKSAYLGIKLHSDFSCFEARDAGLPEIAGSKISKVTPGSPAAEANLRVGDVIYQFNGITIEDDSHLVQLVGVTPVGTKVPFVVYRNGKPITLVVELRSKG